MDSDNEQVNGVIVKGNLLYPAREQRLGEKKMFCNVFRLIFLSVLTQNFRGNTLYFSFFLEFFSNSSSFWCCNTILHNLNQKGLHN